MTGWKRVALHEVAAIEREIVEASAIPDGTAYVGLENIETGGRFVDVRNVPNGELASSKFAFTPSHVLYGKLRPYLAKIARPDFCGVCSTDILPILPGSNLDRDYLAHFLRQPCMIELATSRASGANLPRLSPRALAEFTLPVPPLPEQRRIAEILDQAEAVRAKRREAMARLQTLTQSIFLGMFGDSRSGGEHATVALSDCAEVVSGIAKGRKLDGRGAVSIPYLRVANVQAGFLDLGEMKTIEALPREVTELRLRPGDIVLTEGGDFDKLGRGAMWEGQIPECIHQNHVFRVRVDASILAPKFLREYLQTSVPRSYFLRCAKRTTNLASINMTQLRGLPVPTPVLAQQQEFVRRVAAVEKLIAAHRASLSKLDDLFASLQHRAFRGEL